MPSSVNRQRRQHAFTRGFERPQGQNPYANAVLAKLWQRGREKRLAQSGGVMPPLPMRTESRPQKSQRPGPSSGRQQGGRGRPGSGGFGRPGSGGSGGSGGGQHRGWR